MKGEPMIPTEQKVKATFSSILLVVAGNAAVMHKQPADNRQQLHTLPGTTKLAQNVLLPL